MSAAQLDRTAPLQTELMRIAASDRNDADARAAFAAALTDARMTEAGMPVSRADRGRP
ncbi:hypothetical protein [Allosphingosinicella sp.]|uniref:hypothetical protein n=1 Tax=Allosphingosinicella sp. TaxID=2823234 RepID=UPI003783CB29